MKTLKPKREDAMFNQSNSNATKIVAVGFALVMLTGASFAGTNSRGGKDRRHKAKRITTIRVLPGGSITRSHLDPTFDSGVKNVPKGGDGQGQVVKDATAVYLSPIRLLPGSSITRTQLSPTFDAGLKDVTKGGPWQSQVVKDATALYPAAIRLLPGSSITRGQVSPTLDAGLFCASGSAR